MIKVFQKNATKETEFSKFIREASSGEKKKVFMRVLKDATRDQRKVMESKVA